MLFSCGAGQQAAAAAFPSDEAIRTKARDILKTPNTAADDPVLLEKFKVMMKQRLRLMGSAADSEFNPGGALNRDPSFLAEKAVSEADLLLPLNASPSQEIDMTLTEGELNDILQEMNFDFGDLATEPLGGGGAMLGDMAQG